MSEALLAAIILLPLLVTFLLKSNAALAFLALCAGFTLQFFVVVDTKSALSKAGLSISGNVLSILLIIVPAALTLLLCRGPSSRSIKSLKALLNFLAALALGAAAALMVAAYIGKFQGTTLTESKIWHYLLMAQTEIIAAGVVLSLLLIWLGNRKSHTKDHHKKHH